MTGRRLRRKLKSGTITNEMQNYAIFPGVSSAFLQRSPLNIDAGTA
jgi:hypothetical protein